MRIIVTLFFLLITPFYLFAQERLNHFYELEKLQSKELIKGISVDESGHIWVATDEGAMRFDGNETLLFYKELPNSYTKEIFITESGRYLLLHDTGLTEIVYRNDSVQLIPFTIGDFTLKESLEYPKSIYEDAKGNIWIGETNAIVKLSERGLTRFELGDPFLSISYHHTFSFEEDIFGNLWIAPFKGPLLSYNEERDGMDRINTPYPVSEVSGIKNIKGDYLIITGKEGFIRLRIDSDKNIQENKFFNEIDNISTLEVINQHIYFGTWESGMYFVDFVSKDEFVIEKLDNIPIIDIIDLFFDFRKKELWIAGGENVGLLKNTPIKTITAAGNNRIESVTEDEEGNIYYSIGQFIYRLDHQFKSKRKELFYIDNSYFTHIFYEKGNIWVGDAFGRVFYYDLENGKRTDIVENQNVSINQIFKDKEGNKWFTGNRNGLIKVDQQNQYKYYPSLDTTYAMIQNKAGELFCGSNSTDFLIHKYDKSSDAFINIELEFSLEISDDFLLNDLRFDAEENIWLATNYGLLFIANEKGKYLKVNRINVSGFDPNEPVRSIAISGEKMWIANTYGLVLLEGRNTILFSKDSGLPSKIIKDAGLDYLQNGQLFIATTSGLGYVDEKEIKIEKSPSPILKTILVNSASISFPSDNNPSFPYKSKIEVEFISLTFPGITLEYQTRIVGLDDEWGSPSNNRSLSVASFSDGNYTIQIRAKESGYSWSDPVEFSFTINRPWFKKWWAILGFILLSILIIVLSIVIHNRNLIQQKRNLKKIIDQRMAEIQGQKNEIIEQQEELIRQKEELLDKNQTVYKSQQALNEADMNYLHLKEKQLQDQIEYKNKQITTHALNILQKNETLKELRDKLEVIIKKHDKDTISELKRTVKIIDQSFKLDKDWDDFKLYFEQIYTGFYSKLKLNFPEITTQELRHCALIRLNLSINECASILGISPDSIKVSRARLRKKLNLEHSQNLADFIMGI